MGSKSSLTYHPQFSSSRLGTYCIGGSAFRHARLRMVPPLHAPHHLPPLLIYVYVPRTHQTHKNDDYLDWTVNLLAQLTQNKTVRVNIYTRQNRVGHLAIVERNDKDKTYEVVYDNMIIAKKRMDQTVDYQTPWSEITEEDYTSMAYLMIKLLMR